MLLNDKLWQVATGRIRRLVISMPPRHGKSSLASHYFPAWYLGNWPQRRVLLASYEATFAAHWGRKARDTLLDVGESLFGVRVLSGQATVKSWSVGLCGRGPRNALGGMQTAGAGGPITGKGADLLLIDDPIKNDADARSPRLRQKIWDWYQATAYTRLEPHGAVVLIMTRWHRDDLAGKVLEAAATGGEHWDSLVLPAFASQNDPLGRSPGEVLWPERYDATRLDEIRETIGPHHFASLYQQDPRPEGGSEWPESYFPSSIWFDEWPRPLALRVLTLDPSKGRDAKSGDYSAIVRLGICSAGKLWVEADLARRPITRMLEDSLDIAAQWQPQAFAVEANQFQELLVGELHRLSLERGMMALPLVPVVNTLPKLVRIRTLGPLLAQGAIRFRAHSAGTRLLVDQLRDFPFADHDDGPDALEMAIRTAGELLGGTQDDPLQGLGQLPL